MIVRPRINTWLKQNVCFLGIRLVSVLDGFHPVTLIVTGQEYTWDLLASDVHVEFKTNLITCHKYAFNFLNNYFLSAYSIYSVMVSCSPVPVWPCFNIQVVYILCLASTYDALICWNLVSKTLTGFDMKSSYWKPWGIAEVVCLIYISSQMTGNSVVVMEEEFKTILNISIM